MEKIVRAYMGKDLQIIMSIFSLSYQVGLHAMNVVPSLLYQDLLPVDSVAEMGSFLQRSAAKLHYNISVTDSQGTIDLVNDVTYFVSNPYQLHHTMVSNF